MNSLLKKISTLSAILLLAGCLRNDIRTETFQIPEMTSPAHEQRIALALHQIPGIIEITPNRELKTLTIVFDGQVTFLKNLEYAIVKAGYDLPHWPAAATDKAKLPKEPVK